MLICPWLILKSQRKIVIPNKSVNEAATNKIATASLPKIVIRQSTDDFTTLVIGWKALLVIRYIIVP